MHSSDEMTPLGFVRAHFKCRLYFVLQLKAMNTTWCISTCLALRSALNKRKPPLKIQNNHAAFLSDVKNVLDVKVGVLSISRIWIPITFLIRNLNGSQIDCRLFTIGWSCFPKEPISLHPSLTEVQKPRTHKEGIMSYSTIPLGSQVLA